MTSTDHRAGFGESGPRPITRNGEIGGWTIAAFLVSAIVLTPIVALVVIAFGAQENIWPHLMSTVLPGAVASTLLLMLGVGTTTLVVGTGTAWLITMYRFPGRGVLQWLLLVPLAMPTYLIAFCYVELWDYSGWIQTALRDVMGWRSARDYRFPEIRSMGGAVFVMSFVLYPYVYLTARASFIRQSVCALEAARTLGRGTWGAFREVALPMARPALVAGVTLALMECLNDIGAVEYFGVSTLTISVYATWLERSSLSGAAQLACVLLLFVFALLMAERWSRGERRFHQITGRARPVPIQEIRGWRGGLALAACGLPVVLGFFVPAVVLVEASLDFWRQSLEADFWRHVLNSVAIAGLAASVAVCIGLVIAYGRRVSPSPAMAVTSRLATVGYAVPGTVLAVGVLVAAGALDRSVGFVSELIVGVPVSLVLSGGLTIIVLACAIRFLAVSQGAIEAGLTRVSPNLDHAARTLGQTPRGTLVHVHLPLIRPALTAGAILVFVDTMKELPATLLLRPFDFDTLATHVYTQASLDLFEESALQALMIVVAGLVPVLFLHGKMEQDSRGRGDADGADSLAPRP